MHVRIKLGRIRPEDIKTIPKMAEKARRGSAIGAKTGPQNGYRFFLPQLNDY